MTKKGLIAFIIALCFSVASIIPLFSIHGSIADAKSKSIKRSSLTSRGKARSKRSSKKSNKKNSKKSSVASQTYVQDGTYTITIPTSKKNAGSAQSKLRASTGITFSRLGNNQLRTQVTKAADVNKIVAACKRIKIKANVVRVNDMVVKPWDVDLDHLPVSDEELTRILEDTYTAGDDKQLTIVIDAGHGGYDPGAIAYRTTTTKVKKGRKVKTVKQSVAWLREKDVNLDVVLKVKGYFDQLNDKLKARGYSKVFNVVLTRSTDVFVPLDQRAIMTDDAKADVFISIHHNSAFSPGASGTAVYSRVYDNAPIRTALGAALAASLQQELTKSFAWAGVPGKDDGIYTANYAVLKRLTVDTTETTSTAIVSKALTESAYLSNPGEASLLATDEFRRKEGGGVLYGILVYLKQVITDKSKFYGQP